MSFPRYPKYKDSGVEWLGEVPEHWETWKLPHAFKLIGSGTTPKSDNLAYYEDGTIAWLNTGDLNDGELFDCEKRVTELAIRDHSSLKLYPAGSLIIAMYGATIGKVAMLRFASTVNQACCVFANSSRILPRFMFYWLMGCRQQIVSMATGGGQPNVSQDILRSLRVACPSVREQNAIAAFLDRETTKFDALVEEQRRLIELLKEKRQAVISHAITEGLDPRAKMKPSGIEWLGDVPEYWDVCALNYRYEVALGKMLDEKRISGEHLAPYLRNVDVQWGKINTEDLPEMDFKGEDLSRYSLIPGDLLVCEGGESGRAAVWQEELEECFYQKALHRLRVRSNRDSAPFMFYALQACAKLGVFTGPEEKATIAHLPAETFRRHRFAFPPHREQTAIATFLDGEALRFDGLTAEANHAIDLLQERRTALISAAVTGKIDVRGLPSHGPLQSAETSYTVQVS